MAQDNIGVQAGDVYKTNKNTNLPTTTRTVIMVTRDTVYYTEGYDTAVLKGKSLMEFEAVIETFDYKRVGSVNVNDFEFEDNAVLREMQLEENVTSEYKESNRTTRQHFKNSQFRENPDRTMEGRGPRGW